MRKINIVVTDDVALRQKRNEDENYDPHQSSEKNAYHSSPTKKQYSKPSVEEALFGDFFWM